MGKIRVVVCGYDCDKYLSRCIKSLDMQTYRDFDYIVNIDKENDRKYLVFRTVEAINSICKDPDDIIVCLDADDFLCDEMALQIIADVYRAKSDLLLTHGSYVNLSSNKTGKFCLPYQAGEEKRTTEWRGSHLKTFKYKLFKRLPDEELRDECGQYFKCCADRAMMIPMMEMAGHDRIQHIPMILYCYNDLNPGSVWKTMRDLSKSTRAFISSKKPLRMIDSI